MIRAAVVVLGVLLHAGPLFSQDLLKFQLTESKQEIAKMLGVPKLVADFGADFVSWQYQIGMDSHEEFSHQLIFRKTSGLISITSNLDPERPVDELFPENESFALFYPDREKAQFGVRVRRLSKGRLLLAMGAPKKGQPTGQLVLIREVELRHFHPWMWQQLSAKPAPPR